VSRPPRRGDRFPRSMQQPEPSSRHLHAGRHLGSQQAPPRLIPGLQSIPGFDVTFLFRHVNSGSLSLAFLAHTCRAQRRDFPVTLTTTALDRSSSRWFAASACTAAAEGPPGQQRPAPPSPAQHRIQRLGSSTSSLLQRSWHTKGRGPSARPLLRPDPCFPCLQHSSVVFAGHDRTASERSTRCFAGPGAPPFSWARAIGLWPKSQGIPWNSW
jgi:hypothetical protein